MPTRNYRQLDDLPPSWLAEYPSATTNQHTAPHPTPAEADSSPTAPIKHSHGKSSLSTHSAHFTHHESPSEALKTPRRHTSQQPTKTHHIRPKHPLTSTKTQPFAASIVGQTPRFRKVREQSQVHSNPVMAKKMP